MIGCAQVRLSSVMYENRNHRRTFYQMSIQLIALNMMQAPNASNVVTYDASTHNDVNDNCCSKKRERESDANENVCLEGRIGGGEKEKAKKAKRICSVRFAKEVIEADEYKRKSLDFLEAAKTELPLPDYLNVLVILTKLNSNANVFENVKELSKVLYNQYQLMVLFCRCLSEKIRGQLLYHLTHSFDIVPSNASLPEFLDKVKQRLSDDEFKTFQSIMHEYRMKMITIPELAAKVKVLFSGKERMDLMSFISRLAYKDKSFLYAVREDITEPMHYDDVPVMRSIESSESSQNKLKCIKVSS